MLIYQLNLLGQLVFSHVASIVILSEKCCVRASIRKEGENKRRVVASPQAHQFQSQFRTCGKVLPPYDSQSTVFNDNAAQILTGELLQSKSDIVTSDCNGSGAK